MTAVIKPSPQRQPELFEFRSAAFSFVVFVPKTADLGALGQQLAAKLALSPDFFSDEALVVDLAHWHVEDIQRLPELIVLLRESGARPVAVRHAEAELAAAAAKLDLLLLEEGPAHTSVPAPVPVQPEPQRIEVPVARPTLLIDKPVRTGQQVYARGANLVVLGVVSAGAEVIADGDIHIYAPLRGKALAGAAGNEEARIFTTQMEAELVSIAGFYRAIEEPLPASIAGKPAHMHLDNGKFVMLPLPI